MGVMKSILFLSITLCLCSQALAGWSSSENVFSATWGSALNQVGLAYGDTGDVFPRYFVVGRDGLIAIDDDVNDRIKMYSAVGDALREIIPHGSLDGADLRRWALRPQFLMGNLLLRFKDNYKVYDVSGKLVNEFIGIGSVIELAVIDDIIFVHELNSNRYFSYSSSGQLLKAYLSRPLEMGVVKSTKVSATNYKITVTYSDKSYGLSSDRNFMHYVRDEKNFVYGVNAGGAWRFNQCGKMMGAVLLPSAQITTIPSQGIGEPNVNVNEEYGEPVIAPNGDVYTWKRTPDNYSILKWTWVDDPNVPTGPDAPTGLTLMPSTTGIYLTWTASPSDPGCVTGYEVSRATSAGGATTTVATVNAGVVKYNDTTADAGTTYYYKIRAKAGKESSAFTSEVSGKR